MLLEHVARISSAESMRAAAERKRAEIEHAKVRHDAAVKALAEVEANVATAFQAWLKFGSRGLPPSNRPGDCELLRQEIASSAPMAKLFDEATFECAVARAVVETLEGMSADLGRDVLIAEPGSVIGRRIRDDIARLENDYATLCCLCTVVGPTVKPCRCRSLDRCCCRPCQAGRA